MPHVNIHSGKPQIQQNPIVCPFPADVSRRRRPAFRQLPVRRRFYTMQSHSEAFYHRQLAASIHKKHRRKLICADFTATCGKNESSNCAAANSASPTATKYFCSKIFSLCMAGSAQICMPAGLRPLQDNFQSIRSAILHFDRRSRHLVPTLSNFSRSSGGFLQFRLHLYRLTAKNAWQIFALHFS